MSAGDTVRESIVLNAGRAVDPANPHTHLRLVGDAPGIAGTRVMYGCLRPALLGHANSAAAFARAKITVSPGPDTPPWTRTAERVEVLLPRGACDRFADPRVLMEAVDAERPAKVDGLLGYATFTFRCQRLHEQHELVRTFCRTFLPDLAILLVQHAPHRAASANPPHVHALMPVRYLDALGFAEPIAMLLQDSAHALLRDTFLQFERTWSTR